MHERIIGTEVYKAQFIASVCMYLFLTLAVDLFDYNSLHSLFHRSVCDVDVQTHHEEVPQHCGVYTLRVSTRIPGMLSYVVISGL